ncbi:MAG: adenylate kinase family protein, partial [Candidatus Thermoplasmatota archaeon]|nr:adenylate kinase family protein [Candidatus Thermoplasmatota archaeon]
MTGIRIAITGTPGVGKTTFCSSLNRRTITVEEIAKTHGCLDKVEDDGAAPIDVEKLATTVVWPEENSLFIDGHLSHLLPVDAIILIRCHPSVLRERLSQRAYSKSKIEENVECELIGVIAAECLELPCLELDSAIGIESMITNAERWITDGFKPKR